MKNNYNILVKEVLSNRVARCAAKENKIRREMAIELERARKAQGISIGLLAKKTNSSVSQIKRLLHCEVGGLLTLKTIIRAADVLNVEVSLFVGPLFYIKDERKS